MKRRYKVFTALYEDSNEGWIWMPPEEGFSSRDYITLKSVSKGKEIITTCRTIKPNYLLRYNHPPRKNIEDVKSAIVMNEYYRDKLGELQTGETYEFEIDKVGKFKYCKKIRAFTQHPNNYVKIATWLGLWSVFLGGAGVILGVISLFKG